MDQNQGPPLHGLFLFVVVMALKPPRIEIYFVLLLVEG